jgi:potassium/chloride transporter 9
LFNLIKANYTIDYTTEKMTSFAYIFGVLFSSLTGIMAGANMSGELKRPAKSIPIGTLSAVFFVFVFYFFESVLLAASCEKVLLLNNYQVLQYIVFWSPIVPIGIISTTFSGELSALIGSSRVLKAMADDEIFGPLLHLVKVGRTKSGNPWLAVIISFLIAELVLCIGSLNAIAPLVTIFYLLSYFGINLACLALDLASAPNFRPTFKYFSWQLALVGMFGTITMTFIVSIEYASIAIGLLIALIAVLYIRDFPPEWGSISQALIFHQVRKYLLLLDTRKDHVKFWRPQILLLIANPRSCLPLIDFGNDIKKGGLFVLGNVRVGELDAFDEDPCVKELPVWMNLVDNLKVKAFIELTLSSSLKEGIHSLIRISGLGGMKPNTIMMGFYDNTLPEDLLKSRPFPKKKRLLNYGLNNYSSYSIPNSNSLSFIQFEGKFIF